jgi:hypothetical protein
MTLLHMITYNMEGGSHCKSLGDVYEKHSKINYRMMSTDYKYERKGQ